MRKEDLKVGMLLEIEEHGHTDLCILTVNDYDELVYSGCRIWGNVSRFTEDLTYGLFNEHKVLKVYDRTCNKDAHKLSTEDRELLWKRKDNYTPQVGDVYMSPTRNEFVITRLKSDSYTRLFDDGSFGEHNIKDLDRLDYKFTGRNIKKKLQDLLDAIEV